MNKTKQLKFAFTTDQSFPLNILFYLGITLTRVNCSIKNDFNKVKETGSPRQSSLCRGHRKKAEETMQMIFLCVTAAPLSFGQIVCLTCLTTYLLALLYKQICGNGTRPHLPWFLHLFTGYLYIFLAMPNSSL